MGSSSFYLEIVTPDRSFFSEYVEMVVLKTPQGEVGILKEHAPMVMAVAVGPVRISKDDKWREAVLTEGFMEITREKAIIMVDTAEWPEEIDINRAEEAKKRAQERLQRKLSALEHTRAQAAFVRAMTRLKVGGGK